MTEQRKGILIDINLFRSLAPGWDGYNSKQMSVDTIESAARFVGSLPCDVIFDPHHIAPGSNGNLQLEWDNGSRSIELEFESPELIRYLKWCPQDGIEEEGCFPTTNIETSMNLIKWCMSKEIVSQCNSSQ